MRKGVASVSDRPPAGITASFLLLASMATCVTALGVNGCQEDEEDFYRPPGELVSDSGEGLVDDTVYAPGIRFPLEQPPAYANSQVYGVGGRNGPSGGQCDERNYSFLWRDNYCETRPWDMPRCPAGNGHQGQDIRPPTCEDNSHWTVAVEDGTITFIGSYSVRLVGDSGIRHRYLHMNHDRLAVVEGQRVTKGERIGLVSDNMGTAATTIHLHYDMFVGGEYIPTYMSLVTSYQELADP